MKTWKKHLAVLFAASVIITALPVNAQAASKSKIKLSESKLTLYVGNTKTLKLKGTKKKPKWTSSKKSVATVTKKGKVKAKKKGSTVITAKLGKKKYKCKVTVKSKTAAETKATAPASVPNTVPTTVPTTVSTEKPVVVPDNTPTKKPITLPEETATAVPTDKPTVTPTEKPTVTPTTPPVLPEDYQTLADYITMNGTPDSEGEYYSIDKTIEGSDSTLYSTILYDVAENSFEFVVLLTDDSDGGSMVSLVITPPEFTKGNLMNIYVSSTDDILYANGKVTLSSVTTTNTGITYTDTNATAEIKDSLYELGDLLFNLGLQTWSSMLEENNVGLSLKNLGFTSYEG